MQLKIGDRQLNFRIRINPPFYEKHLTNPKTKLPVTEFLSRTEN